MTDDLDWLAENTDDRDIDELVVDIQAKLERRGRQLITTDLVAAELDELTDAARAGTDQLITLQMVRARYAVDLGHWEEAAQLYAQLTGEPTAPVQPAVPELHNAWLSAIQRGVSLAQTELSTGASSADNPQNATGDQPMLLRAIDQFERAIEFLESSDIPASATETSTNVTKALLAAQIGLAVAHALSGRIPESLALLEAVASVCSATTPDPGSNAGHTIGAFAANYANNPAAVALLVTTWGDPALGSDQSAVRPSVVEGLIRAMDPAANRKGFETADGQEADGDPWRLQIHLGQNHVPSDPSPESWALLSLYLPQLRQLLHAATGIVLPPVNLIEAEWENAPDDVAIEIDGSIVASECLPTDRIFVPQSALDAVPSGSEGIRAKGTWPEGTATIAPLTGQHGWWIPASTVAPGGTWPEQVDTERFLVRRLAEAFSIRLDSFVDRYMVMAGLFADGEESRLSKAILAIDRGISLDGLVTVMQDLAADGYPLRSWQQGVRWPPEPLSLVESLPANPGSGADQDFEFLADRLRSVFRDRLPGNDGRPLQAIDSELEDLLREPGTPELRAQLTAAVGKLVEQYGSSAFTVKQTRARRPLRDLIRDTGVAVPVLTVQEAKGSRRTIAATGGAAAFSP